MSAAPKSTVQRVERWIERLDPLVLYCENDQPYDKEDARLIWVLGHRTSVGYFLSDHRVADALQSDVAAGLRCRECGREGFDLWDDIGLETSEEREHRERWAEWDRKYHAKVEAFAKHLEAFPYLGLAHPLGRRIHRAIADFPRTTLGRREWWRARKPEGARGFKAKDMAPPPPDKATSEGRFNHYGQVVFYLASSPDGAMAETLDAERRETIAWVQQFGVPAKTEVLDLVAPDFHREADVPILALGLIHRLPSLRPNPLSPWKPEYFLPRFIADCAREQGIAGVVFESRKHIGKNLALFTWTRSRVRARGVPELKELKPEPADDPSNELLDFDP